MVCVRIAASSGDDPMRRHVSIRVIPNLSILFEYFSDYLFSKRAASNWQPSAGSQSSPIGEEEGFPGGGELYDAGDPVRNRWWPTRRIEDSSVCELVPDGEPRWGGHGKSKRSVIIE